MIKFILFLILMIAVVMLSLWFAGRGRDFKMRNDEIFERELRKRMKGEKTFDI